MNSPRQKRDALLFALSLSICSASAWAQISGYSDGPIRNPVFDSARVVVDATAVNNWLNANISRLPAERLPAVREHVHALIDSRIKEIYARDGSILPKQPDPILPILFSWAGRLGVHGADATYAAVRGKYPVNPPPAPLPPRGLQVALDGELLRITSERDGWRAAVPYYFFIFAMNDGIGADKRRSQAVVISMGTALDAAQPGYSQATIALFYSPKADARGFVEAWSKRFEIEAIPKKKIESTAFESQSAYDSATRLHKEVVFLSGGKGVFTVLYSGLDGTYQWNRQHFIDFLASLKTGP